MNRKFAALIAAVLMLAACTVQGRVEEGYAEFAWATYTPTPEIEPEPTVELPTVTPTPTLEIRPEPEEPTLEPTQEPTLEPTAEPTVVLPTVTPTITPTVVLPTVTPTATPTAVLPTATPTAAPTLATGATHTIASSASSFSAANVNPGDRICLAAGTRGPLTISDAHGTAEAPITITDCFGPVTIQGGTVKALTIRDSTRVLLRGQSERCGAQYTEPTTAKLATENACSFRIIGGTMGISIIDDVRNIEIAYLEIGNSHVSTTHASAIRAKDTTGETFDGLHMHHLYLHDINNECVYVGDAESNGLAPMKNVTLKHSLLLRCGWDAVDWKQVQNGEIAYNILRVAGNPTETGQGNGVTFVLSGNTHMHHNTVESTATECIKTLNPKTGIVVEYNIIKNCGGDHVTNRFNVGMIVRYNELWKPGSGINVGGTDTIAHNNIWKN